MSRLRLLVEALETRETPSASLAFAIAFGSSSTQEQGTKTAVDAVGNIYVLGDFSATMDVDPGPGTFNLVPVGNWDIFLSKFDSAGNFLWAHSWGSSQDDFSRAIVVDAAGNPYLAGVFRGTMDVDPGPGTFNLNSLGNTDFFVCKLDAGGNFVWADSFGGSGSEYGTIRLDSAGNLIASGSFSSPTVDFDPGPGTANLVNGGSDDGFILKLDSAANLLWVRSISGPGDGSCDVLTLDAADNIFTGSQMRGTVDFDPGVGVFNVTSTGGNNQVVLSKLDANGNFIWAKKFGDPGNAAPGSIVVDPVGNVYFTGFIQNTGDFDPGAAVYNLGDGLLSEDIFVCKVDSAGNLLWANSLGSAGSNQGYQIALDGAGNVFNTGTFWGPVDFDPGPSTSILAGAGGYDAYLCKQDSAGNLIWAVELGGSNYEVAYGMTLDGLGGIFLAGYFNGPADFDPGAGIFNLAGFGGNDIFLAKLIDDSALVISPSAGSASVAESGATDTYTVALNAAPSANVVVTLNPNQVTVTPGTLTFTSADWNLPQTVTVAAIDDAVVEGNHTGVIANTTSSADPGFNGLTQSLTADITDNDNPVGLTFAQSAGSTDVTEGGAGDFYTVVLDSAPTANVIIVVNPSAQLTLSAASLIFTPANWNMPQTVTVSAFDDTIGEGNHTGVITHTAASADPLYNGIAIANITANITDDDIAGIAFTPTLVDVTEGGASSAYTAVMTSQPTANVIVNINAGTQVAVAPASLIFTPANWNLPQTVAVTAIDDSVPEGLHSGVITHSAASADLGYNGRSLSSVTATITDNENPGVLITQTNGTITILEASSKTYTAVLNKAPAADVVLTMNPDAQLTVSPAAITFTPADWNVPRPVIVTAFDDGIEEGDHLGFITHATSSTDNAFNNLTVVGVTAHIVDNDGASAIGSDKSDQIAITFAAGKITVTINGKATNLPSTLTQLLVFAGAGNDTIQVAAPTIPVVIEAGQGTDKVIVTGQNGANAFVLGDSFVTINNISVGIWNTESLIVSGKSASDTFAVMGVPAYPVELKGDLGTDQVLAANRPNTWQITGTGTGSLDSTIKLTAVENWTGGPSSDAFVFAAAKSLAGQIDGGGGPDVLDYSAYTSPVAVNLQTRAATGTKGFANIAKIIGGKDLDTLTGPNQSNAWSITNTNAGSVSSVAFQSIENLTGGNQYDTFQFVDGAGVKKIDGSAGNDLLDWSGYLATPVAVNLQTKTATNLAAFANIEQFTGGSGLADNLIGPNKTTAWNLTATGAGDVAGLPFASFENLTGGTLADTFSLALAGDWLGTLSGGGGQDILSAFSGGSNVWTSTGTGAGTLNGRKFTGIEIRR